MRALVTGAGGFIGGHLVRRLLADGHDVVAVDDKLPARWRQLWPDAINLGPYRFDQPGEWQHLAHAVSAPQVVFHLAARMGNIEYIQAQRLACAFSTRIDMNLIDYVRAVRPERLFYSSSACVYPAARQAAAYGAALVEHMAWPADPEPGYGLQKLYTEELLRYLREDEGIETRVARYHSVYGPHGAWTGGREKVPAALCRKVADALLDGSSAIEVWGDGQQTRTYMHVDDCVEGTIRLALSDHPDPVNLGSDELVSIDYLAGLVMGVAGADLDIEHVAGPQGARGRNSDNSALAAAIGWTPGIRLADGIGDLYGWVYEQVVAAREAAR